MARKIGTRRGKSPIKTRLEQERKAGRKDPEGKKSFRKGLEIASYFIPGGAAVKVGSKGAKVAKAGVKKLKDYNKGLAESNKMVGTQLGMKDYMRAAEEGVSVTKSSGVLRRLKPSKEELKLRSLLKNIKKFKKNYGAESLTNRSLERATNKAIKEFSKPKMKKGGIVKSHRGDGIAKRGRTKGRII